MFLVNRRHNQPFVCQPFRVRGCILTLVERMDEEFTKIMQNTDPHSQGVANSLTHSYSLTPTVMFHNRLPPQSL